MPSERPTLEDNFCCCAPAPAPLSRRHFLWLVVGATAACAAPVIRTPKEEVAHFPLLDAHSHHAPPHLSFGYTLEELLRAMDEAGIQRMVVLGAREELARRHPDRLIASYIGAPFRIREGLGDGSDPKAVEKVGGEFEAVLNRGVFRGIGEVHTHAPPIPTAAMGGQGLPGSNISPDSPLIRRLIELVGRYEVPINIHCEDYAAQDMLVDFFSNQHLARAQETGEMYRLVLSQLTPATARKIGYQNAERLYALPKA